MTSIVGTPVPERAPSPPVAGPARLRRPLARAAPLALAVVAGALVALLSAHLIWPRGTTNLDEVVYLNQAEALRHGELTYDAATYLPDFRPYMAGVAGDRVVFKYQPLWPAVLALSGAATGDHRAGLAVAGGAIAAAFWLLGRELTGSRWAGTATALVVVASPAFVSHGGSVLAYLPAAGLSAAAVATGLRAGRTGSWGWAAGAGVLFGALFFHRPYDAVLAGVPLGAWLVWRARHERRWRVLPVLVLAAVPGVSAWLAYNRVVTGHAFEPAFSVGAPDDGFGFGPRSSWTPDDPEFPHEPFEFTPAGSLRTVGHFALITPLWVTGGVVAVALAVLAAAGRHRDGPRLVLAAIVGTVVAGHALWWGTQNFVEFGLQGALGPAYWLGALGPVMVLAVAGARDLAERLRPAPAMLGAVAVVAVASSVAGGLVVVDNLREARRMRDHQVAVETAAPEGSVLLLPGGANEAFVRSVVPADLAAAPRLVAHADGTAAQPFRLRDRGDGRALWAWVPVRPGGSLLDAPEAHDLGALPETAAPRVGVALALPEGAAADGPGWLRLVDDDEGELARVEVPLGASGGGAAVAPEGAGDPATPSAGAMPAPATSSGPGGGGVEGGDGSAPAGVSEQVVGSSLAVGSEPVWLAAGVTVVLPGDPARRDTVEVRWPVRARDGQVEVMGPGVGHRLYAFPGHEPAWVDEDVSASVSATVEGLAPFVPVRTVGWLR